MEEKPKFWNLILFLFRRFKQDFHILWRFTKCTNRFSGEKISDRNWFSLSSVSYTASTLAHIHIPVWIELGIDA